MAKKAKTKDEKLHMRAVADLGCIICHKMGYPGSCLLYTSPSPRDKRQSRMPSSA